MGRERACSWSDSPTLVINKSVSHSLRESPSQESTERERERERERSRVCLKCWVGNGFVARWCCSGSSEPDTIPVVIGDTCSGCHMAAVKQSCGDGDYQVIYASFHVDVSETPFFIAVDYDHGTVVVSIRGTLSMKVTSASSNLPGKRILERDWGIGDCSNGQWRWLAACLLFRTLSRIFTLKRNPFPTICIVTIGSDTRYAGILIGM